MSKKNTCRICASSGSRPRPEIAVRWSAAGTVSFSSTLSAFFASSRRLDELLVGESLLGHRLSVLMPDYAVDVRLGR